MSRPHPKVRAATVVLAAVVGLAACTRPANHTQPRAGSTGPRSAGTTASGYRRPCDTSVYGALPRGWEHDALVAGPIAFVGLGPDGAISARALDQRHGSVEGVKLLAVVAGRTQVTVSVDPRFVDRLSLGYDPQTFNRPRIGAGDSTVVFPACHGGGTMFDGSGAVQFNGGLIVKGDLCADLLVRWRAGSRTVPLALGRSC